MSVHVEPLCPPAGGKLVEVARPGCQRLQPSGGRSGLLFPVVNSGGVGGMDGALD